MVKVIQINVGGFDNNFSYLILGEGKHSKEGVLIDPAGSLVKIEEEINKHGAIIVLQIFTHLHPDHTELLWHFKGLKIKTFSPKAAPLGAKEEITAAGMKISILHTPGHTKEGVCFIIGKNIFSGDTLFVRGVGTTAYGGNDEELSTTLNYLFTLDQGLALWPGHDYGGASSMLGTALKNSHLRPDAKILEKIKKRVAEYESGRGKRKF